MIVLANDGLDTSAKVALQELGIEVDEQKYQGSALLDRLKEVDFLVVRSATKVGKEEIDAAVLGGKLQGIIRAGVGIDNIDVAYAREEGISVNNTPNSSTNAVAEMALGQMLTMARFVNESNLSLRQGKWNKSLYKGIEIKGKTLGVIGFGRVGRALGEKAKLLGMKVQFYDEAPVAEYYRDFDKVSLESLLKTSDFISIHIPDIGRPVLDREALQMMKKSAYLVNTARGSAIDTDALIWALKSGEIAGAALDVYEVEPLDRGELLELDNISLTPHIGGSTREAQEGIGEEIVSIIKEKIHGSY